MNNICNYVIGFCDVGCDFGWIGFICDKGNFNFFCLVNV